MNKILFTNDDGYESKALHDLYHYVSRQYSNAEKIMIAPNKNRSGVSHAITLDQQLIYREKESNLFEVEGTPADCVMAAYGVMGDIDLVVSGPNLGSNLGQDIIYSGTVAAAREGALRDIPALAFSFVNETEENDLQINYDDWHAFLDKWFYALVKLAQNNRGCIVSVNICMPIGNELIEGTLGSRYYYNYQHTEKGTDHRGEHIIAMKKMGMDLSQETEEGSDVDLIQQGKNVFSVFSAWPKLKLHRKKELLSYMKE